MAKYSKIPSFEEAVAAIDGTPSIKQIVKLPDEQLELISLEIRSAINVKKNYCTVAIPNDYVALAMALPELEGYKFEVGGDTPFGKLLTIMWDKS